jgi:hypothetical protein
MMRRKPGGPPDSQNSMQRRKGLFQIPMMKVTPTDLFSRNDGSGRLKRAIQFPMVRMAIALLALSPAIIALACRFTATGSM